MRQQKIKITSLRLRNFLKSSFLAKICGFFQLKKIFSFSGLVNNSRFNYVQSNIKQTSTALLTSEAHTKGYSHSIDLLSLNTKGGLGNTRRIWTTCSAYRPLAEDHAEYSGEADNYIVQDQSCFDQLFHKQVNVSFFIGPDVLSGKK